MLEEIVCDADCDTGTLPVVSFDDCNPEINKSEITRIFMALPDAADFTDESDPEEWAARLSQTAVPPAGEPLTPVKDLIRELTVIADKPASTEVVYAASNNRSIITDRTRVINVTIDETNDDNYDLMRKSECGAGIAGKFWYISGGKLYGGKSGLKGGVGGKKPVLKLGEVLERGVDAVATYAGTITWSNLKSEKRVVSPFL